eukprot:159047-Rhodomonas_salina.1
MSFRLALSKEKLTDAAYLQRCTIHGEQYIGFLRARLARLEEAVDGSDGVLVKAVRVELAKEEASLQWLRQVKLDCLNSPPSVACPPGMEPGAGGANCTPCVVGTFKEGAGNGSCAACQPGSYGAVAASRSMWDCTACEAGKYQPDAG